MKGSFYLASKNYLLTVWLVVGFSILFLFIIATIAIVFVIKKRKQKENLTVEQAKKAEDIILFLGKKENIKNVENRNERVEFEINDATKIDIAGINSLNLGATLTKNIIKFSIKQNDIIIIKEIRKILRGER